MYVYLNEEAGIFSAAFFANGVCSNAVTILGFGEELL
jgi:hypothetical protein